MFSYIFIKINDFHSLSTYILDAVFSACLHSYMSSASGIVVLGT